MVRSLSDVFERLGLDVLAIDADPQGNLSDYFDADPRRPPDARARCSRARRAPPTRSTAA